MPAAAAEAHVELAGVGSYSHDCQFQHDRCSLAAPAAASKSAVYSQGHVGTDRGPDITAQYRHLAETAPAVPAMTHNGQCCSISSLLQQAGPHTAQLQRVLQLELAETVRDVGRLSKVGLLVDQQRSSAARSNHNPAGSTGPVNGMVKQQQQQRRQVVHVLPLLGSTLAQLLSLLTKDKQQGAAGATAVEDHTSLLLQLLKPGNTPLSAALDNSCSSNGVNRNAVGESRFLCALASEILRTRQLVQYCYYLLQQKVANIGQHLPPVPEAAQGDSSAPKQNRRQSQASADEATAAAAAAAQGEQSTAAASGANSSSNSAAYHSLSITDLSILHDHASAVSSELVQLDDFISSSYKQLAHLAQQYDTLLTAAAIDASSSRTGATAASAPAAETTAAVDAAISMKAKNSRTSRISLLGLLARRHQQQQQHGSKVVGTSDSCPSTSKTSPCEVNFVLLTPGVASHSSCHPEAHNYTAGVPPDIYHQTTHKLITTGHGSEPVLWGLSVIYARIRHAAEAAAAAAAEPEAAAAAAEWTAPDQFTRSTTKYWVHPSDILRLKLALLRHLPLLVYGAADPVYRGDIGSREAVRCGSKGATSLVSSVYFDSAHLDVYHTRLARDDGARLVRLRYYGPRQTGAAGQQQPVFVERKTHRQKWTGNRSIKERAGLVQSQVSGYLSGAVPPAELSNKESKEQLLAEVRDFINTTHMGPAVRTEYMRTAWQRYDSNTVRLSLDEHMLLLREKGASASAAAATSAAGGDAAGSSGTYDDWCACVEPAAQLAASDVVRFPYGILEIKLQEEEPEWIQELKESGILVQCPKFSKFLHGMALLYPEHCANSPRWFIWDDHAGVATPATLDKMKEIVNPQGLYDEEARADILSPRQSESNSRTTTAPASQLTAAPAASAASVVLPGPSLSPLKIPRLDHSNNTLAVAPAVPAAAEAAEAEGASAKQTLPISSYAVTLSTDSNSSQQLGPHITKPAAAAAAAAAATGSNQQLSAVDVAHCAAHADLDRWMQNSRRTGAAQGVADQDQVGVLCGVGLHTPLQPGSPSGSQHSPGERLDAEHHVPSGWMGGGSGPFNAGINSISSTGLHHHHHHHHHHQQQQHTGSPPHFDTTTLLPRSYQYSDSHKQQQGPAAAVSAVSASAASSYTSQAVHDIIIDQHQLHPSAAAAAAGCSPTGTVGGRGTASGSSSSSIRRLVDKMMSVGKKNRNSSSSDQQLEEGLVDKQDASPGHNTLYVTNPLEIHHLHSRHPQQLQHHYDHNHHKQHCNLSSCSTSSADTITTGSGAARHHHGLHSRTNSSLGLPSINDSTPTAAAAGERLLLSTMAAVPGMDKLGSHGSSSTSSSWQLSTEAPVNMDLLKVKRSWDRQLDCLSAPAGSISDAICGPDHKPAAAAACRGLTDPGWGLTTNLGLYQDTPGWGPQGLRSCKDTAKGMNLPSLLSQQIGLAARPQHHVIQVNHVRQAESDIGQPWVMDAAAAAASVAAAQEPSHANLHQYLPPVPVSSNDAVAGTPVAVSAAAVAASAAEGKYGDELAVHIVGDSSSNGDVGGVSDKKAKRSRARALLQQIKSAAGKGRWRGKGRSPTGNGGSDRGSGRNEHMLGFTGSAPRTKAMVRARAEPKTFFANERTFLSWLQISVLVMMTGLGLLGGSTLVLKGQGADGAAVACMDSMVCRASRISGAIIAPVSVLFMLYALYTFKKRTHQIRHQMTTVRYDDQLGPVLLTMLLVGVTVVSITLTMKTFL